MPRTARQGTVCLISMRRQARKARLEKFGLDEGSQPYHPPLPKDGRPWPSSRAPHDLPVQGPCLPACPPPFRCCYVFIAICVILVMYGSCLTCDVCFITFPACPTPLPVPVRPCPAPPRSASACPQTGVCEQKKSSGEEDPWENQLTKHQSRGWRAVSAAGVQGERLE